jgi:hypothetical protein
MLLISTHWTYFIIPSFHYLHFYSDGGCLKLTRAHGFSTKNENRWSVPVNATVTIIYYIFAKIKKAGSRFLPETE